MARVTVEDCIRKVSNRFELVLMAATRSRQISSGQGQPLLVERDNDRDHVVALREIADGKITSGEMNEKIISDLLRPTGLDEKITSSENQAGEDSEMSEEDMLKSLALLEAETNEARYAVHGTEDIIEEKDLGFTGDDPLKEPPDEIIGAADFDEAEPGEPSEPPEPSEPSEPSDFDDKSE